MQAGNEKKSSLDMEALKRIASSPEARQLLQRLQQKDPERIKKVAQAAQKGDYGAAQSLLSSIQKDKTAESLIHALERQG